MARLKSLLISAALAVSASVPLQPAAAEPAVVRIQGSTTFHERILKPRRADIEAAAGVTLDVVPNKSVWGLQALLEGRCDMAMLSADLTKEVASARVIAPNLPFDQLRAVEVARTEVGLIVNAQNTVRSLTLDNVKRILTGEIKSWKELGGADMPIKVIATQNGGGTVMAVRSQLLGGAEITAAGAARLESARHVVKAVEQEPGAFGIAQRGLAKAAAVSLVQLDKPIEQRLSYVTLGAPSAATKAVIDATIKIIGASTM